MPAPSSGTREVVGPAASADGVSPARGCSWRGPTATRPARGASRPERESRAGASGATEGGVLGGVGGAGGAGVLDETAVDEGGEGRAALATTCSGAAAAAWRSTWVSWLPAKESRAAARAVPNPSAITSWSDSAPSSASPAEDSSTPYVVAADSAENGVRMREAGGHLRVPVEHVRVVHELGVEIERGGHGRILVIGVVGVEIVGATLIDPRDRAETICVGGASVALLAREGTRSKLRCDSSRSVAVIRRDSDDSGGVSTEIVTGGSRSTENELAAKRGSRPCRAKA